MIQQTSLKAYFEEVKPTLGKRQKVVLEAFKCKENFTNTELADFLQWPINCLTPRVFELREKGLLEEIKRRSCKVTGRTAIAWSLSKKGIELLI